MRWCVVLTLVAVCGMAVGCSSDPSMKGKLRGARVSIETEPSQAKVTLVAPMTGERTVLGHTPVADQTVMVLTSLEARDMPAGEFQSLVTQIGMIHVIIEKDGYQRYEGNLAVDVEKTRLHKIALVPVAK